MPNIDAAAAFPVMRRAGRLIPATLVAVALGAGSLTAQSTGTQGAGASRVAPRQGDWMVSVNPIGLLYGGLTGEAERKLSGTRTIAAAVNYWGYGGASYLSMDAKLRFYHRSTGTTVAITNSPATDFEGLSYGPMVGFQRVSIDLCAYEGIDCSATGVTAGGTVDYGWRLGKQKQFAALAGAGVKTGFGFGDIAGVHATYPFVRFGAGYVIGKSH